MPRAIGTRRASTVPRVTGIGGIFFKAADPASLARWYEKHLGVTLSGKSMSVFH